MNELTSPAQTLASERVIINAPMSFAGAWQRSWRLAANRQTWSRWTLVCVIPLLIVAWWSVVACWYVTFGLLLVPYRLLRRGARKRKAEALRHREMLAAIESTKKP